jgi:hypothetical protein
LPRLGKQQQCDQITADNEKNFDAKETAAEPIFVCVIDNNGQYRNCAKPIEPWQISDGLLGAIHHRLSEGF